MAVGLVLMITGFAVAGTRGPTMVFAGLAIASLAGLELSLREHFAGYRSHTLLLSGAVGLAVLILLAFAVPSLWLPVSMAIALVAFGAAAWALTRAFRRRSGLAFKLR